MAENNIDNYLRWITPRAGDPTFSLLKAHLLFEELLFAYLGRTLPHSTALEGARLTFVQLLAVARASSPDLPPDHWIWKAIGDLNKLRNVLSHEARPKALEEKASAYVKFVVDNIKIPLPELGTSRQFSGERRARSIYSKVDMVTIGLYYHVARALRFNVDAIIENEERRTKEIDEAVKSQSHRGDAG